MTFRWPWVSRRAYDEVREQRDRLYTVNDRLIDQITRMSRKDRGMPEVARPAKPPLEMMPKSLAEYIGAFAHPSTRRELLRSALQRHARGEPWATIELEMKQEDEPQYG